MERAVSTSKWDKMLSRIEVLTSWNHMLVCSDEMWDEILNSRD